MNHIRNKLYTTQANSTNDNETVHKKRDILNKNIQKEKSNEDITNNTTFKENLIILKNLNPLTQYEFLKQKLKDTLDDRVIYIQKEHFLIFADEFPFFFTAPNLVCIIYISFNISFQLDF